MQARSFLPVLFVLTACGGSGGGDDDPTGPGEEDFLPPPENPGGGMPDGATSQTCALAEDCDYWYCRCDDGAVVNSAFCVNSYCMDAATACPPACDFFDHGAWTGSAGGGPGSSMPEECGGLGSANQSCDECFEDQCCGQGEACGGNPACLDYWDCAVACGGDATCREECDFLYPDGVDDYGALESCLVNDCASECGS